ncbi:MAG: TIGR02269 family lipoprotein [Acidimicrobiaceae bacterium]|nr:TIGR02269 family lipoprotein [Acidimicrobiaceae bacterium]
MSLELPGWLVTAFNVVGLPWPGIDEDQLRAWATSLRQFTNEITESSAKTHSTVAALAEESQSSFTDSLEAFWEHHHRLVTDLHGPLDDFAEALDVAADVVVAQKYAVIAAASLLAGEFVSTQVGAFFTFGADEAAVPFEIASTREAVKLALEYVEQEVMGKLIGMAAQAVSDHVNGFLNQLLNDAFPVVAEVQSLKISYEKLGEAAKKVRSNGTEAEESGERAHRENANRDLEDSSEGGDDFGDGGGFAAVIKALAQALEQVGLLVFVNFVMKLTGQMTHMASIMEEGANALRQTDEDLGDKVPDEPAKPVEPVVKPSPDDPAPESPWLKRKQFKARASAALARDKKPVIPTYKDPPASGTGTGGWDAHHIIPQIYRNDPRFEDFDFDAPSNIRGVPGNNEGLGVANIHNQVTQMWKEWQKANPNATRPQIEAFAQRVNAQFEGFWWRTSGVGEPVPKAPG